jgi:hypothetical protein
MGGLRHRRCGRKSTKNAEKRNPVGTIAERHAQKYIAERICGIAHLGRTLLSPISCFQWSLYLIQTFPHTSAFFVLFFALCKDSSLLFSSDSALFAKNMGVGGGNHRGNHCVPRQLACECGRSHIERGKKVGQTFLSAPSISVDLVLGREPVLGQQMSGDFAQVPDDAEPGEDF